MLFIQNSFEISYEFMKYRDVGVGVEKWKMVVFIKMHSVLVLWKPILPCATTFTTYGKRRSHVVCSY